MFARKILGITVLLGSLTLSKAGPDRVYFGTYTKDNSKGIYVSGWDSSGGKLKAPELAAEIENPSFIEIDSSGEHLYAVSEIANFKGGGSVTAFQILESGKLEEINRQPTGGGGPCHVSLSPDGKFLAVANYGGGSVASYRVESDGSLSEPASIIQHEGSSVHPKRQAGPHAHSINFSKDGRFTYAADLGTDSIYIYGVGPEKGALVPSGVAKLPGGSGPRHFAFRPDGKFGYVINEMTLTVTAFSVSADTGALAIGKSVSTLPPGTEETGSTAEVVCHPNGKFLYGSNRGHDSIVVYQIDGVSGDLSYVENEPIQGEVPRNFSVSPDGKWLLAAGQKSNTVSVFSIDPESGALEFSGEKIDVPVPVCVRFLTGAE